jgi:hypothetical protein
MIVAVNDRESNQTALLTVPDSEPMNLNRYRRRPLRKRPRRPAPPEPGGNGRRAAQQRQPRR